MHRPKLRTSFNPTFHCVRQVIAQNMLTVFPILAVLLFISFVTTLRKQVLTDLSHLNATTHRTAIFVKLP